MAWKIDLNDALYSFDPCLGCPEAVTIPATSVEPPFETCRHDHLPGVPCAWDRKEPMVSAFIEQANEELAEILS